MEQGQQDVFEFDDDNINPIKRVRIRHDNSGNKPGWFLEHIILFNLHANSQFTFPCNRWLARDQLDGRIDLILDENGPVG
jgi:hypothetical protein